MKKSINSLAVLQPLSGIVAVVRVYDTEHIKEPAPYKFFTIVEIIEGMAKIHGLLKCDVTVADLREIGRAVKRDYHQVESLCWTHKGFLKTYKIKA